MEMGEESGLSAGSSFCAFGVNKDADKGGWKEGQWRIQRNNLDFFLQFPLPCRGKLRGASGPVFLHLSLSLFQVLFLEYRILSRLCLSVQFNDVLFLFSISNSGFKHRRLWRRRAAFISFLNSSFVFLIPTLHFSTLTIPPFYFIYP